MSQPFRLRAPRESENDIESACLGLLALHGYWVVRLHAGTFKSVDGRRWIRGVDKGTPDYAALHGQHRNFLMEVKRPGGTLSPDQQWQHEYIRKYGLAIATVESKDELSAFLAAHERVP